MTRYEVVAADTATELAAKLNTLSEQHRCAETRFVQLATNGDENYAVLVAWEEE